MKKIEQFQITGMTISGFKSYQEPTELSFGNPTTITGGNGRGKTSIADAIAFVVTGQPFFGERGIDKLHNEIQPDVFISLRFVDETGTTHELTRTRRKSRMVINYDGYEIRQMDLTDMFGERDVFLSIFNPLYFIEELGDEGKNLLETHLPMISHEAVLSNLSDPVRAALEGVKILSPDSFLKGKREEVRKLEERMIYLRGQKDQAAAQDNERKKLSAELSDRCSLLETKLRGLEEKRFAGLDPAQVEARLVELSARYGEVVQDSSSTAEIDAQILSLNQKLAQRRAEQYQSKYAQAMANAGAKVTELGKQYRREAQIMKTFVPGVACPTCRRPVTEQNLSEVQGALQKVIDAIVADGQEQQAQLKELQELDTKAQAVFGQFQTDNLREEIQRLSACLEYGNLSQQEYEQMNGCRADLLQCQAQLRAAEAAPAQKPEDFDSQIAYAQQEVKNLKVLISNVIIYTRVRAELTFETLKMNKVAISLYDVMKTTGEQKAAFKFTYNGRRYDRLSLSEKIRAGMEVSELMKRLTGRNYPVFVDNMESVDDLANVHPTGQVIMAKCVHGAALEVRPLRAIPTVAEPQAA